MWKTKVTTKPKVAAALAVVGTFALSAQSASASIETILDINGNGVYDTVLIDRWEDGGYDIAAFDQNENGLIDFITIDINNDEWSEVALYDTNQNGIIDVYTWDLDFIEGWENSALDLNENGVDDAVEREAVWSTSGSPVVVGPVTSPQGLPDYLATAGDMVTPFFGSPDWDDDGTPDYRDSFPGDDDCDSATDTC